MNSAPQLPVDVVDAEPSSVVIRFDNRLRISLQRVDREVEKALKEEFTHKNPKWHQNKVMGFSNWDTPATIKTWQEESRWGERWLSLPRGGLARVRQVLDEFDLDRHFIDDRTDGVPIASLWSKTTGFPDHLVPLYPFQEKLVQVAMDKTTCILKSPTGSGKTAVAIGLAARLKLATIVIVPSIALLRQWMLRAEKELGLKKDDVGIIQGSHFRLRPLTIAVQKTLASRGVDEQLSKTFGVVIYDECHLAPAKTCFAAVDPFHARYRIGVSDDHRRKDRLECLTHDLFGGIGAEVNRRELIDARFILDVEVRIVPTDFRADWYGLPEEDPDDEANGKSIFHSELPPEKELDIDRLYREMGDDDARNMTILKVIGFARALSPETVLVMSHRREHCRLLDQLCSQRMRSGFLIGGPDYRVEFENTLAKIEKRELDVAVGTFQAVGTGIDMPWASTLVATMPIASNKYFCSQVRGRICRAPKGKTVATMFVVWDQHVHGDQHVRNLANWNKNVFVWDHERWVDAKTFLRARRVSA